MSGIDRFDPKNATSRWRGSVKAGKGPDACKRAAENRKDPKNPFFQAHLRHCAACRAKYAH